MSHVDARDSFCSSLQRFKLNIANSVVTQQNSGLASMDTDLVLDLFRHTTTEEEGPSTKKKDGDQQGTSWSSQKHSQRLGGLAHGRGVPGFRCFFLYEVDQSLSRLTLRVRLSLMMFIRFHFLHEHWLILDTTDPCISTPILNRRVMYAK